MTPPIHPEKLVADRFEIGHVAGSGGMGVVYKAHDRRTDRAVALKVLLERDQGPADRFAQEIELLSTLDHPNIVGYVSHGVTKSGAPYLVMPWLDGIDLQERVRQGALSIDETLTLARRVADALACLHGRGLVHRDLKPSNLFLPDGNVENVKLIDFGVARPSVATRGLTASGTLIGTPGFIAPEEARGDREVAPAVDIFALGCVLFECLTSKRLFSGAHVMSVLAKILLEDATRASELRADVPPALDALIHRMVSKEPEKRPSDGADLAKHLDDLDSSPPTESRARPAHTLTESERRVLTVLVVVLPTSIESAAPLGDQTRVEVDPFYSASARFGVRAHFLAERTAIVVAPERASAADQATVLVRFARYVVEAFPSARVALTTGSTVTGARLPVGEAIERAVTMVRKAAPTTGTLDVRIDDVTAALVTSRFDIKREGGTILVENERISIDPTRPLLGKPTSCVGREFELSILEATFVECQHGRGPKVVLVTAAAGAGKSRLRHEIVRRLQSIEAPPITIHCQGDPLHMATPYTMIAQAVRRAANILEREPPESIREKLRAHVTAIVPAQDAERVADFLGELVGAAFDDERRLPLRAARRDATAMADQISRAFEDILRAWASKPSLFIVLEDLQWADAASVKALDRALRKLDGAKLVVLALARPDVHERFPALFPNHDVAELRLPPIPKRACAKLVREVMGEETSDEDVARLVERSEGNGFYLEELIRAAATRSERTTRPSPLLDDELPDAVIAVAQARLERLEPNVRKVLRAASVFGDHFWLEGVSALVGDTPRELDPIVTRLVEQEVLTPSEHPRFAGVRELGFRHELLRRTAYATLTEEDRALGHRLAAEWLERVGEDGEVVALHWLDGKDQGRAAATLTRVGEARLARAQADAAARCAARALLVCDPKAETSEATVARMALLASALEASRSLDARDVTSGLERHIPAFDDRSADAPRDVVKAALDRSLDALRSDPNGPGLVESMCYAACALGALADFGSAKELLAEATVLAGEAEPSLQAIRHASAKIAFWAVEMGTTVELLVETILPEDPRARFDIVLLLAIAVVTVDGRPALARGLDFVGRGEAILRSHVERDRSAEGFHEDPVARVHCAKARYLCFVLAGEYARAAEAAEAAIAIARQAGLRYDECAHLHNAGEQYLRLGDRARARAALVESNEIARDLGAARNQTHNNILLAFIDGQVERLSHIADDSREANDRWLELFSRYWLGHLLAANGVADARSALMRALDIAGELKVRTMADDCTRAINALDGTDTHRVPAYMRENPDTGTS